MSGGVSKGKRRASSPGTVSNGGPPSPRCTRSSKKTRTGSLSRVQSTALAKIGSTSGKGIAGLTALVRNSRLSSSAASKETKSSRRGAFSSHNTSGGSVADADTVVSIGTIIFVTKGVELNEVDASDPLKPLYCLQDSVDVSPSKQTAMIQCGLAVRRNLGYQFTPTDSYPRCDEILRGLFPKLFDWMDSMEDDDTEASSWLVCTKLPYCKGLMVSSTDRLPTGFDLITATGKQKSGIGERVLFLATRYPVPPSVLLKWRPQAHAKLGSTSQIDIDRDSDAGESGDGASDTDSQSDEEDANEVESEVIEITSDSDYAPPSVPSVNPSTPFSPITPPHVDSVRDTFLLSMTLDDEENPWH